MKKLAKDKMLRALSNVAPEMIEGIAGGTLIMNGGYKVLDHDEIVDILKESLA